jgi:hypothetical protein
MLYRIYAALKEDIDSGHVWILFAQVDQRPVISIKNAVTGKRVYCEALKIDPNFERIYECGHTLKLDLSQNPIVSTKGQVSTIRSQQSGLNNQQVFVKS